jgi:hypothetical protein
MNPTIELTHPLEVVTDDQGHYRSECGCGWTSDWYLDDDMAAALAGVDHMEIAVGPPDALDQVMGELLGDPVTRRPSYDQEDRRYWCSRRTFGRVTLDAWGLES